jgi:stage V sporulation protein B
MSLDSNDFQSLTPENTGIHEEIKTLSRGTQVTVIGNIIGRVLTFISQLLLARLLGPSLFGIYMVGWTLQRVVMLFSTFGFDRAAVMYGIQYWKQQNDRFSKMVRTIFLLAIAGGLLIGSVFFIASPFLANTIFSKPESLQIIRFMALSFFPLVINRVANGMIRITKNMKYVVWNENIFQPLVNLVLVIAFWLFGWGVNGAAFALLVSYILAAIQAFWMVWRLFPEIRVKPSNEPTAKSILGFSIPAVVSTTFGGLSSLTDRLVLAAYTTAASLGIYQAAGQFSFLFTMILYGNNAILAPMISDLYNRKEMKQLDEIYKVSTKWMLYFSLPISAVTLLAPGLTLNVFFGKEYEAGAIILILLTIAQLINVGTGATGTMMLMTNHASLWAKISSSTFVVGFALCVFLTLKYGWVGTAVSTIIGLSVMFGIGTLQLRKKMNVWPYDRRYWKGLVAGAASAVRVEYK